MEAAGGPGSHLIDILSGVDETAYTWDLTNDRIEWASNARQVLTLASDTDISTGAAFQFLVAPEHVSRRLGAATGYTSTGAVSDASYRIQYRFMPLGRGADRSIWLEEHGRQWVNAEGRLVRAQGVVRVINERHREEQRLLYRSDYDEMTGQLNNTRLMEAFAAASDRAERLRQSCAFLMVAVDNLAVVNQTFGFEIGDKVIVAAARLIKAKMRSADTLGRYSSNKFGIILHDCGPGAVRIASERFLKAVRDEAIDAGTCKLSATISIGSVLVPGDAQRSQEAVGCALEALDMARSRRGDAFRAYEPSPARESARKRNITISDEVLSALAEDRMQIALQPIVSSATRKPALYECLLRMVRVDGTTVSAGEFIQVAEQLGLIRLIDRRTLQLAVAELKRHPTLRLSLNVSGLTCSDHDWLVAVHRMTGGKRSVLERLTIEITETAAIDDLDQSSAFVDSLKELGCRVAIDDFGAGYTSFKNLKALDVDMVKIDGAFVKDLAENADDRFFLKTLVDLATAFGRETVAEWVGSEAVAQILTDVGITHMQGYHFGEPRMARDYPWTDETP